MKTDDELIDAYKQGEETAFAELVERHISAVYTFAYRMVGKKEEAEDVAQETFIKFWKSIGRFRKGMRMRTWLLSIARNTAIDYLRKRRSLSFSEMGTHDDADAFEHSLPDPAPSAESVFGLGEDTHRLEAALMKLPLIYREIVLFHYREGLTLEETAQTLKIPLNTAKSRDRRALIALRKLLATQ